jgi:lysophospholipase
VVVVALLLLSCTEKKSDPIPRAQPRPLEPLERVVAEPDAGAFETNPLTSDRERWSRNVELAAAAPHLALGSATIGWARAAFRSMDQLAEPVTASRIVIPMLIFVAGGDQIVDPGAVDDFASRLKNATRILLPTAKHEILQETDLIRSEFWAAFDAYLGVESLAA